MPFGFKIDELTELLTRPDVREDLARYAEDRGRPLKVILAPEPPVDPLGEPERTTEFLAAYVAIGATGLSLRFVHHSPAHFCEQMAVLRTLVGSAGWSS